MSWMHRSRGAASKGRSLTPEEVTVEAKRLGLPVSERPERNDLSGDTKKKGTTNERLPADDNFFHHWRNTTTDI